MRTLVDSRLFGSGEAYALSLTGRNGLPPVSGNLQTVFDSGRQLGPWVGQDIVQSQLCNCLILRCCDLITDHHNCYLYQISNIAGCQGSSTDQYASPSRGSFGRV